MTKLFLETNPSGDRYDRDNLSNTEKHMQTYLKLIIQTIAQLLLCLSLFL